MAALPTVRACAFIEPHLISSAIISYVVKVFAHGYRVYPIAIACVMHGCKPAPPLAPTQQMVLEASQNPIRAQQTYGDQKMLITGRVAQIATRVDRTYEVVGGWSRTVRPVEHQRGYAVITPHNEQRPLVACYFMYDSDLAQLNQGQTVSLVGRFSQFYNDLTGQPVLLFKGCVPN